MGFINPPLYEILERLEGETFSVLSYLPISQEDSLNNPGDQKSSYNFYQCSDSYKKSINVKLSIVKSKDRISEKIHFEKN